MHRRNSRRLRLAALILALSVVSAACGDDDDDSTQAGAESTTTTALVGSNTEAAEARTSFHGLLQEHVFLAADATGAALQGRTADFQAAATALDANSAALTAFMSSVFGDEAGKAFDPLWKKHIGFIVDYVEGTAAKDAAKQDKAMSDLVAYTADFGAFINSALKDQPAETVAELVKTHVLTLKDVIDAQNAKDPVKAYDRIRAAAAHMDAISKPLSVSIASHFKDKIKGDPASPASSLLDSLNTVLREHVFLAADATGAALEGRAEDFAGAAAALDANSDAVTDLVASALGSQDAQTLVQVKNAFGPLWKKHVTFIVDYTNGLASGNGGKSAEAVSSLTQYAQDFGAFINSALPSLSVDAVAGLVGTHISTLKAVIDAQNAKDSAKADTNLRQAVDHMLGIAQPLTGAIVKKFPNAFPGAAA